MMRTFGHAFAAMKKCPALALQDNLSAMLRLLRQRTNTQTSWTTSGYVCRSCRLRLQSARRLQSTAATTTEDGGGAEDWLSNFNSIGAKTKQEVRVKGVQKPEQKQQQHETKNTNNGLPSARKEPRTRRYPSNHPAFVALGYNSVHDLRKLREKRICELQARERAFRDAASHQGSAETKRAGKNRATAFVRTPPQGRTPKSGPIESARSLIGLLDRAIELKQQGLLDDTASYIYGQVPHGVPRANFASAGHPALERYAKCSTEELMHALQHHQKALNARPQTRRDQDSDVKIAENTNAVEQRPVAALAQSPRTLGATSANIRSEIALIERVINLRDRGAFDNTHVATKEALYKQWMAIRQTLNNEFGMLLPITRTETKTASLLQQEIVHWEKLLRDKREEKAGEQQNENTTSGDRSGKQASDQTPASTADGLNRVIAQLKQEFRGKVEYASNVSGRGAAEEQKSSHGSNSLTPPTSVNTTSPKSQSASGLDKLRQRLQKDTNAKADAETDSPAAHEYKDKPLQAKTDTLASEHELPLARLSMPRFAAKSDTVSFFSSIKPGREPTIAQKVRSAKERPKWGLVDDAGSEAREKQNGKPRTRTQKQLDKQDPQAQDGSTEQVAAFFADSPADLAELQSTPPSKPAAATPKSTHTTHSATTTTVKREVSKAWLKAETSKTNKSKEQTLDDLKQSLSAATQTNKRTAPVKAVERTKDHERVKAIERNVQEIQSKTTPKAPVSAPSNEKNASASLANLHSSKDPKTQYTEVAPSADKKPEVAKGEADQTEAPKPAKTGGRKRPRASRTEKKSTAAAESISKASGIGGDSGDSGNHKPLWEVMKASESAPPPAAESKPTARDNAAFETPDSSSPIIDSVKAADLHVHALKIPQPPVPGLEYGLDRVLFNPGVYQLQDPSSRVYNFDPYLQDIMPAVEFDFNALKEYKTSSEDKALSAIAKEYQKRYIGSTSSMTSTLAHFHYLLSNWRKLNLDMLSRGFSDQADEFTRINRAPNAIFLRWKPESKTYAIDADKEFDGANVLMMLGKSMEKMLTLPTSDFEKYRKSDPREVPQEARDEPEAFEYTSMGDFLMRSQLDAYDPRLPGNGMFDLKTRAVLSVRMDAEDFEPMLGYEIHTLQGRWNSYEREYYDMMRSTMLKYMLQARMGRMQGIFAAYHNIERIFGFQYIPMMDLDRALHGQIDPCLGDQEFKLSLNLLNQVLNKATARFPEKSLRFHFETTQQNLGGDSPTPVMSIFAEPMEEKEINRIQSLSKEKVREFEKNVMGVDDREVKPALRKAVTDSQASGDQEPIEYPPATPEPDSKEAAATSSESEDQAPTEYPPATLEPSREEPETTEPESEEDTPPTTYPPVAPEPSSSSSPNSDLDSSTSAAESDFLSSLTSSGSSTTTTSSSPSRTSPSHLAPLFAATLMAKSRVNGEHVTRPSQLKRDDDWTVEYLLTEYPETEVTWAKYVAVKGRRKEVLVKERDEDEDVSLAKGVETDEDNEKGKKGKVDGAKKEKKKDYFIEFLQKKARKGREFRRELDAAEVGRERKFAWKKAVKAEVGDVGEYMGWLYKERGRKV